MERGWLLPSAHFGLPVPSELFTQIDLAVAPIMQVQKAESR
jgi:hypothetical protein